MAYISMPSHKQESRLNSGFTNPPFHLHETGAAGPFSGVVYRGVLSQEEPFEGEDNTYKLYFLYNPSVISMNYEFLGPNDLSYENMAEHEMSGGRLTGRNWSFDLFFDRTFEVSQDTRHQGVLVDTYALEKVLGVKEAGSAAPIPMRRVRFTFSTRPSSIVPSFVGFITSVSIEYVHFTHMMVPSRSVVRISMQQIYEHHGSPSGQQVPGGLVRGLLVERGQQGSGGSGGGGLVVRPQ